MNRAKDGLHVLSVKASTRKRANLTSLSDSNCSGTYRGGGVGYMARRQVIQSFEKTINYKKLQRSVAVHSSFTEILICQFVPIIFDVAMATADFMKVWPKVLGEVPEEG